MTGTKRSVSPHTACDAQVGRDVGSGRPFWCRQPLTTLHERPFVITLQSTPVDTSAARPVLRPQIVRAVLCDADGTLFPSEEPAYAASALVTQAFAERHLLSGDFSAQTLRREGNGRNFRAMAEHLWSIAGRPDRPEDLEEWIERERSEVTAHLGTALRPDPDVLDAVTRLAATYSMAVVSSSALSRLEVCFRVCGLDDVLPADVRFSAEDSLPIAASKPDPAVYRHALDMIGLAPEQCVAIEDAGGGVRSAVSAGIPVIGLVRFVPKDEREQRIEDLYAAGAALVVSTWQDVVASLTQR